MYIDRLKAVIEKLNKLKKVFIKTEPCTQEEILLFEKDLGLKFPKAYEEYLLWDGRNSGIFFTDYAFSGATSFNREIVNEMLQEISIPENVVPDDAIIFYVNHGAYCFAFIRTSEGDNPPVHFFYQPDMQGIEWNDSKDIEEFCLKTIVGRYHNLADEAIAALEIDHPPHEQV